MGRSAECGLLRVVMGVAERWRWYLDLLLCVHPFPSPPDRALADLAVDGTDVNTAAHPNPRGRINHNSATFAAFEAGMLMFGFCLGIANFVMTAVAFTAVLLLTRKTAFASLGTTLAVLVVLPVGVLMGIMPFFGAWIVLPLVENVSGLQFFLSCFSRALLAGD